MCLHSPGQDTRQKNKQSRRGHRGSGRHFLFYHTLTFYPETATHSCTDADFKINFIMRTELGMCFSLYHSYLVI